MKNYVSKTDLASRSCNASDCIWTQFFASISFEELIFISAMYFGMLSPMMRIISFLYLHKLNSLAHLFPEEYSQYIEDRNAYINILNEERVKRKVSRYSTKHENMF